MSHHRPRPAFMPPSPAPSTTHRANTHPQDADAYWEATPPAQQQLEQQLEAAEEGEAALMLK